MSQLPDETEASFQQQFPFSVDATPKELMGMMEDVTGTGKSLMPVSKTEILISQHLDETEAKFRKFDLHFRNFAFHRK